MKPQNLRVKYGVYFVDSDPDGYFTSVTVVLYVISYYTGQRYNGIWL